MISGNIGSESLRRFDFTVIGEAVNLAQALQTAADEGQIIITESSYKMCMNLSVAEKWAK